MQDLCNERKRPRPDDHGRPLLRGFSTCAWLNLTIDPYPFGML